MNKAVIAAVAVMAVLSAPVLADMKIGYVDVRAVLAESNTGKQHRATVEKYIKDKQAALKKEEEKLNGLKQSFEKEALTLSDAQKQQKQKEFQDKVQALQKTAQDAERELQQKDREYTSKSIETVRTIVAEVAREEKVNLVIGRGEVLYAEDGMDLTAKVSQKFDARAGKK
jgi:outer membrane protein